MVRRFFPLGSAAVVAYAAALLIVCVGAWQIRLAREVAIRATEQDTRNLSRSLGQQAARSAETVDLVLTGIVARVEAGALSDPAQLKRVLDWRRGMVPQILAIMVLDASGDWIVDSMQPQHDPINTADRPYFAWHRDHPEQDLHIDPPVASRLSGTTVIPLTRRWNRPDGSFGGVVFAALSPEHFQRFYESLGLGSDGLVTLLSQSGRMLARHPSAPDLIGRDFSNTILFRNRLPADPAGSYIAVSPNDGIERIVAYESVEGYPLVVYVGRGLSEVLAPWRRDAFVEGSILCLAAAGLVGLGIGLGRHQRRAAAAEAAVSASEARYRQLAETTSDVITRLDLTFRRTYVSPTCRSLFGYAPEEMLGHQPSAVIHPDEAPAVRELARRLVAGEIQGDQATTSYRTRHKLGHTIWIESALSLVRDAAGVPEAVVCTLRDVTERKHAEQALAVSEARYRMLADNTSDVIMLRDLDPRGGRSYVSPAVRTMLGYEPEEFGSIPIPELVHPEDLAATMARYESLNSAAPSVVSVHRLKRKDGSYLWVEIIFRLVGDSPDGLPRVLGAIRDVSERQRHARHLEQARAQAEEGARVKAEFLANMSHELRTPLTGMLGVHDLLQGDPSLTDRQRRFVDLAQDSGRALLTIVNDILDFSKIEAGQMTIERVPFCLRELFESCRQLGEESIRLAGVRLTSDVEEGVPDLFLGDPTRLRQVLLNLTSNAIKFTTEGLVEVRVRWSTGRLRCSVSDTGIGIPAETIPNLFERFSQADGSTARRFGGTGLGLAICKHLVELMGGGIGVESAVGRGSTFWFEVPLAVGELEASLELRRYSLAEAAGIGRRILVAEDNRINQEIIQSVLAQRGHELTMVADGAAAVEAFQDGIFDLILMDVQMPGTDGLAATREIRRLERIGARPATPVVALTANAMAEEAQLCREAGMDAHVAKPIDWKQLFSTVDRLCRSHAPLVLDSPFVPQVGDRTPVAAVLDESAFDDLTTLLGRDRIGDLLAEFRRETERRLSRMAALETTGVEIGAHAHALVSLAGQLGFAELSAFCAELERRAADGAGATMIPALQAIAERALAAASIHCRAA